MSDASSNAAVSGSGSGSGSLAAASGSVFPHAASKAIKAAIRGLEGVDMSTLSDHSLKIIDSVKDSLSTLGEKVASMHEVVTAAQSSRKQQDQENIHKRLEALEKLLASEQELRKSAEQALEGLKAQARKDKKTAEAYKSKRDKALGEKDVLEKLLDQLQEGIAAHRKRKAPDSEEEGGVDADASAD